MRSGIFGPRSALNRPWYQPWAEQKIWRAFLQAVILWKTFVSTSSVVCSACEAAVTFQSVLHVSNRALGHASNYIVIGLYY